MRWAPDVSSATIWTLPATALSPSKIVRLEDGKLWISFFDSSQLGRFDEKSGTLDLFNLLSGEPYDIHNYRGLVAYTDERARWASWIPRSRSPRRRPC